MTTHCIPTEVDACKTTVNLPLSCLSKALAAINSWWQNKRRRTEDRRAIEHLLTLDDAMLKDIGVSRADVEWISSLPNSVNAAVELEIVARGGGGRRR